MTHPYLRAFLETTEQGVVEVDGLQMGTPILTAVGLLHLAAKGVRDELRTIADAQHGQTAQELREVYLEGLRVVDAVGRAAEDDADDVGVVFRKLVVGQDLAKGVKFANAAAYQLCGL